MPFEIYVSRGPTGQLESRPEPTLSLANTNISLNRAALDAMGLTYGDTVALEFDRVSGSVGLRLWRKDDETHAAVRVYRSSKTSHTAKLGTSQGFYARFHIDPTRIKGLYTLFYDRGEGLWICRIPSGSWAKPGNPEVTRRLNEARARASNGAKAAAS